ncbi:hypothetical protein [Xanthobacter agilis]|uniref:Uncharacterized protein n=1 Tax=Xanthobacter agilis TaxID=47492 RepID=A0ABU0LGX6_XANAG|nr:hypothetical protein [Xanthobacter agilis]MDQ0506389.1 hypothetical protein [Xanthobacter agilis]
MNNEAVPSIPFSLQVAGKTVFEGTIFPQVLQEIVKLALQSTIVPERSFPLKVDQAQELLRNVDPKTVEFLRVIAANNGEITFSEMKSVFQITKWVEYSSRFGKGLTRALRTLSKNSSATLVFWDDDEWESANDPDGSVYIDGQALASLQAAFGMNQSAS